MNSRRDVTYGLIDPTRTVGSPTPISTFRHTYATHLVEAGVPVAHLAELLGDTIAVVESTYAHVSAPSTK